MFKRFFCKNIKKVVATIDVKLVLSEQKKLDIKPVHQVKTEFETATFGMGCYWGAEALYGATKGVIRTTVGYAGGTKENPTYKELGDHTEVLEIDYDPKVITYDELLDLFWNNHEYEPTKVTKRQYASLILIADKDEKQVQIACQSRQAEQLCRNPDKITTAILAKTNFYPGEDYNQKYRLQKHKDFAATLQLDSSKLKQTSYVATKLNGYLAGVGCLEQFKSEADTFGLTPSQLKYCIEQIKQNADEKLYD